MTFMSLKLTMFHLGVFATWDIAHSGAVGSVATSQRQALGFPPTFQQHASR